MDLTDAAKISSANARFANKFYTAVSKKEGNVFFSPLSAHTILALAYQGSGGKTEERFKSTLEIPNKALAANGYHSIMGSLNSVEEVALHIANKIFVMTDFCLKNDFKKVATESFLSETESVDFSKSQEAADNINQWVEKKTNSKIKDLISSDDLGGSTRLVLVNAIYFKGNWANQFRKEATRFEPFFITSQNKVDCQMMHIKEKFNYCENASLDAKILEMPYSNENVSMVFILPNNTDGITDLENKLVGADLSTLTNAMRYVEVEVSLPKFKIETSMDLEPILTEMGLGIIFESMNADFSQISESGAGLYVSKAIQKAFIEVNEEGAEAAAATGLVMAMGRALVPIENIIFKADHPFVILLQSKQEVSTSLLFYGRISKPESKN